MEKRNFITTVRTADAAREMDELVKSASGAFGCMEKSPEFRQFEKQAGKEDEKSDHNDHNA